MANASILAASDLDEDPIFEMISKCDKAERAWLVAEELHDLPIDTPTTDPRAVYVKAFLDAFKASYRELVSTPPQTTEGLVAYCRWMKRYFEHCLVNEDAVENLLQSPVVPGCRRASSAI